MDPSVEQLLAEAKNRKHLDWLEKRVDFRGLGVGLDPSGRPCLKVFFRQVTDAIRTEVNHKMSGLPLHVEAVGDINALASAE
jgi:hypothetical protein